MNSSLCQLQQCVPKYTTYTNVYIDTTCTVKLTYGTTFNKRKLFIYLLKRNDYIKLSIMLSINLYSGMCSLARWESPTVWYLLLRILLCFTLYNPYIYYIILEYYTRIFRHGRIHCTRDLCATSWEFQLQLRVAFATVSICGCHWQNRLLWRQADRQTGGQTGRQTETDRDGQTANSDAKLHGIRIINEQKTLKCKVQMACGAVSANWWQLLNPRHFGLSNYLTVFSISLSLSFTVSRSLSLTLPLIVRKLAN